VNKPILLRVEQVSKAFRSGPRPIQALHTINLSVYEGEILCIVGPSGSGKSTLLRIMGGLLSPDAGHVLYAGDELTGPHEAIGFVFQKTNLLPWRTVLNNVLLPVVVKEGRASTDALEAARQLLALVGLSGDEDLYPSQLSGGMSQRVALARALLQRPKLLLMDEPFGALDALTRERLNVELLRIHSTQIRTIVMVTHDINEAVLLADRVVVLSDQPGRVFADMCIDLPHPRSLKLLVTPRFGELALEVRQAIGQLVTE
jgi:NitT/TauT family transport system ATP-binding protein